MLKLPNINNLPINEEFIFDEQAESYINRFLTKFVIWIISFGQNKSKLKQTLAELLGEDAKYLITQGENNCKHKFIPSVLENYSLGYFISGMVEFIVETCKINYDDQIIFVDKTGKKTKKSYNN